MATTDLGTLDRGLYALFSRHADRARHERDRKRYRGANLVVPFDRFLARVYGLSWVAGVGSAVWAAVLVLILPPGVVAAVAEFLHAGLPVFDRVVVPHLRRPTVALAAGLAVGVVAKTATVRAGGLYLKWVASARRSSIDRTLPGAVRYLRALATGSDDREALLRKVAEQRAYGETSATFRRVLTRGALTGSLDRALRETARDTPSRELLAPFLLKFREHASRGGDALESYLRMESRMLSHRQARERQRASDFLELLAELFIVLLVLPALLVIIVTVLSVLAPGLSTPVRTPLGTVTTRAVIVYGAGVFAVIVGACAALLVDHLRPPEQTPSYERPGGLTTLATAASNPASAAVCALPLAIGAIVGLWALGYGPANALLLAYVAYALPVGTVAVRRARRDDAKDREIKDFVHAVAGHVSLGRPFPQAVKLVARDVDSGALQSDVNDLAFTLSVTTHGDRDVRTEALARFTDRVGTPLAEQTMGLVMGALDVGGDTEEVFETLQTEVGRLYHERKALRSTMLVYVAVGWTTALLIVGITLAVNASVLDGFAQLSAVSQGGAGVAIDPNAVDLDRDRRRFYVVTQATMLACGWFAGTASRDRYEALLHSGALVGVCYVVFAGTGMI